MKELRYRIWDENAKVMRYFIGESEPQLFTGFMDASGNRIYEGDEVTFCIKKSPRCKKFIIKTGIVVKDEYYKGRWYIFDFGPLNSKNISNLQVAGNIYENP